MSDTNMNLDLHEFCAAIFDLDGALVHSEHVWDAAKLEVLDRYGFSPSQELLAAHVGRGLKGFLDDVFGHSLSERERSEIGDQIGAVADELLPKMREPVAGAADLLCHLHNSGSRIAVRSSCPRRHIVSALDMLSITGRVETIVSGAELPSGKPGPLPYRKTLEALDLQPISACAFEDSRAGVTSAMAAGLTVLAIGPDCTHPDFSRCAYRAENFDELISLSFGSGPIGRFYGQI